MPRLARGGRADLVAGLAGGAFAPLASLGGGLPLWASLPGALLVFAGLRLALTPKAATGGFDPNAYSDATHGLAAEVLDAAGEDIARLDACIEGLRPGATRERLAHMRGVAAGVVAEVGRRPDRLDGVSRLLTYYVPACVRLGEGLLVLERAHRPDARRIEAASAMLWRLDEVFAHHADRVSAQEIDGLDVELRLLGDAIRAEEGARARTGEGNGQR